jgi:hypothetical protein
MDFFLLPVLLGAGISFVVCGLRGKRRVSLWLALYTALATGISIVLFSFGLSLFTLQFWTGGKAPGVVQVPVVFALSAAVSSIASWAVISLYRGKQHG